MPHAQASVTCPHRSTTARLVAEVDRARAYVR